MIALTQYIASTPRRMEEEPRERRDETAPDADKNRPRIVRSEELLQGARELWVEHGDEMYRLRLTRSGKLYLTK
ncbi:MAG TPA: hemin uptake protein HemP [Pirellulaceae bacterium]|nr:hemin uptake protein HemP [Pirellulaceae bacterium]